jgi:hypothetical protein
MMNKRAILTGGKSDLQAFLYEWYSKDQHEDIPVLEDDMDVVISIYTEEHANQIKGIAHAFDLHCFLLDMPNGGENQ